MAQDINVSIDYFEHPKTRRLVGLLKKGSEVIPIRLWCYCGKYHAETGRLTDHSAQEIEAAVGWWGASGEAVKALLKVGFLDEDADGTYTAHDWPQHNGHLYPQHLRAKAAANKRWETVREKARLAEAAANASKGNAQAMLEHCSNGTVLNDPPPNPRKRGRGGGDEIEDEITRKLREERERGA